MPEYIKAHCKHHHMNFVRLLNKISVLWTAIAGGKYQLYFGAELEKEVRSPDPHLPDEPLEIVQV